MRITLPTALCLAAALLPAASHAATTTQSEAFSGTYNPTTFTEYDGVAVYGSTNSGNFTSLTLPVFTSVAVNTTAKLGPVTVQVPTDATNLRVSVCSVYGGPTSSTVSLILDPTYAASIINGNAIAFATAFGGTNEATVASYIQGAAAGNAAASTALESFFNTYNADFPLITNNAATGTIVTFSNAAAGGAAGLNLAPVPEPGTWRLIAVAAAGLGLCQRLRRRLA